MPVSDAAKPAAPSAKQSDGIGAGCEDGLTVHLPAAKTSAIKVSS